MSAKQTIKHQIAGFVCFGIIALWSGTALAEDHAAPLQHAKTDLSDEASLQRGAATYMNYCLGCHSLQYARYKSTAAGIGIHNDKGEVYESLVQTHLNLVSDRVNDPIRSALQAKDGEKFFGVAPPDLTLVARVRGNDWLYSYLKGFYLDSKRPLGVNNIVFPDVGMPNVLVELQGEQKPVMRTVHIKLSDGTIESKEVVDHLELAKPGSLSPEAFDRVVLDLVNFLDYMGEPIKLERQRMGVWILLFLVVFLLFAWLLKREYWKDVH
ncbi:MAG: cytochrome c1 [Pseudomonadota bacterium]